MVLGVYPTPVNHSPKILRRAPGKGIKDSDWFLWITADCSINPRHVVASIFLSFKREVWVYLRKIQDRVCETIAGYTVVFALPATTH